MNTVLTEILNIKGVQGIILLNAKGAVVSSSANPGTVSLRKTENELSVLFNNLSDGNYLPAFLQVTFDQKVILFQSQRDASIACVCQTDVSTSLVRMTLDVSLSKLTKDRKFLKILRNS